MCKYKRKLGYKISFSYNTLKNTSSSEWYNKKKYFCKNSLKVLASIGSNSS